MERDMDVVWAAVAKAESGELLSEEDLRHLLALDHRSPAAGYLMAAARELCREACGNRAEIHVQIGVNLSPCPLNCRFCSFAAVNGVFEEPLELELADIIERSVRAVEEGANAVFLMATGDYPMKRFAAIGAEVRSSLGPDPVLVANVGDLTLDQARSLKQSGFDGIYHATRMGEGRDTSIPPERRLKTFRNAQEAGLVLGTCVEPIGPEHTVDEIIEKILIHREANPCFSGAMRRIPIPGTALAELGQIDELHLAYLVAVVRLAMGRDLIGNCTHEPNVLGAASGANLFWAEIGPNPRDTKEHTEEGRGLDIEACRTLFAEAGFEVLEGPSRIYRQVTKELVRASA